MAASAVFLGNSVLGETSRLKRIGIQLFSVPKLLSKNFRGAIEFLAGIGYKEIEMYGPFPFSVPSAIERWNEITPSLGFSGSGYFGHSAREVKAILKDNGMTVPAIHTDLDTLENRMEQLGEAGNELGFTYVGLPAIPDDRRKNLDDYRRIADGFNRIGEAAKKVNLKFSYHNHGYGLVEMERQIPLQIILDRTEPSLVFLEMDVYWTTAGGADPLEYLESYPDRYHLMHLKDMKEKVRFSGDGGDAGQWIELFPYMTSAGNGILDLGKIIPVAQKSGVKHFFVEQDMVAEPETALKASFDYLKSL
jgi:sugar phosphate isomerase/epimerase